jgi:hypothetical protein
MVEKCQTDCKQTGGAIFCDGQFLNADNVNSCADELSAKIKINVDIKASVSVAATKTKAAVNSAGQKASTVSVCTVTDVGAAHSAGGALGALSSLTALALWQTRRRRDRR